MRFEAVLGSLIASARRSNELVGRIMGYELASERGNLSAREEDSLVAMRMDILDARASFEDDRRTLESEFAAQWRAWLVARCEGLVGAGNAIACLREVLDGEQPHYAFDWAIAVTDLAEEQQLRTADGPDAALHYAHWLELRGRNADAIAVLEPAVRGTPTPAMNEAWRRLTAARSR